ncbi:MAG: head maturation protease, ClpP-related [Niveispirillum sp.]|uniref:head maturation protease, ClpP-related n=1 Tax=Niveispirillum sp. TaxID=1917217 RepID=UPI004036C93E
MATAPKKNSWYRIGGLVTPSEGESSVEITIYDEIGYWGINASSFIRDLRSIGAVDRIDLRINSPGGDVFDGAAIYNLLLAHPARVVVHIDGLAASMASVVAMAGDEINIGSNAFVMIHNPWSVSVGDADEMRSMADLLDQIGQTIVTAYERKTGLGRDELTAMMNAETWMAGDEAVAKGFADHVTDAVKLSASANFRRLGTFGRLPENLKALADPEGWAEANEPVDLGAATTVEADEAPNADAQPQENRTQNSGVDSPGAEDPQPTIPPADAAPPADVDPAAAAAAQAAEIARICAEGGIASRASELIARRATVEEVRDIVQFAGAAKGLVDRARKIGASLTPAAEAEMTSGSLTVEQVRARLFDLMVAGDARLQIDPALSPAGALGSIISPRNTPMIDAADAMDRFAGRVR